MRYGEDWWTPEEAEDGVVPHTAVFDPISGVYRRRDRRAHRGNRVH